MAGSVKVKVREGWAVYDGTKQRGGGETLEVDPASAEEWLAAGWSCALVLTAVATWAKTDAASAG
jgi:hypothetical protein